MPPAETWLLWRDTARNPALNMAIDEALLETATARDRVVLRFYEWDRPAVTIGYVQKFSAAPAELTCIRRPTGGGVVFHDHDFTYSVAFPAGHWLAGLDSMRSYNWVNRSVQAGLARCAFPAELADAEIGGHVDRATMVCFTNPTKYDIILAGRKVGGSAQRRTRTGILHQGSIHFGGPLPVEREALAEALIAGFAEEMSVRMEPFDPDEALLAQADLLLREKYATEAWNRRR